MLVSLVTNAIVGAERFGSGRLSWAWVFYDENDAAIRSRSEAMFKTRAAALRAGELVMRYQRARVGETC